MVTRQMQVERRTGKVRRPKSDVLPMCHATNKYSRVGSTYGIGVHQSHRPHSRQLHYIALTRQYMRGWHIWTRPRYSYLHAHTYSMTFTHPLFNLPLHMSTCFLFALA